MFAAFFGRASEYTNTKGHLERCSLSSVVRVREKKGGVGKGDKLKRRGEESGGGGGSGGDDEEIRKSKMREE